MCLITDSLAVSAIPEGSDVDPGIIDPRTIIEDGVCKLSDRSALAGSISTMDRLVRTAVQEAGISMLDACQHASWALTIAKVSSRRDTTRTSSCLTKTNNLSL